MQNHFSSPAVEELDASMAKTHSLLCSVCILLQIGICSDFAFGGFTSACHLSRQVTLHGNDVFYGLSDSTPGGKKTSGGFSPLLRLTPCLHHQTLQ